VKLGQRESRIDLADDRRSITASTDGLAISFELATVENDEVCLSQNGKAVSSTEAAKWIMDPFMFGKGSLYEFKEHPSGV